MKKIIAVFLALMLLAAGALGEGGEAAAPVSAEEVRGEPAIGARLGFEPVSYTHLDVYKRQERKSSSMRCGTAT